MRSRLADALVLLVVLPVWMVCFALCVREAARDTPFPILRVRFSDSSLQHFPVVMNQELDLPGGAAQLKAGDRVRRWNDVPWLESGRLSTTMWSRPTRRGHI